MQTSTRAPFPKFPTLCFFRFYSQHCVFSDFNEGISQPAPRKAEDDQEKRIHYRGRPFPDTLISLGHQTPGPAIAIRGVGHERLCSPRILEYGPWYLYRDEATDTTVVQFHEDTMDLDLARAQAEAGHMLLGHEYERHIVDQSATIANPLTATMIPSTNCYHINVSAHRATKS